jgi:hypothetical protein
MTALILILNGQNILIKKLNDLIIIFVLVNILKIINQFRIIKSIGDGINNINSLISERVFDFIKIGIYTIVLVSYESFCISNFATYIFITLCVNYAVIIIQFIVNLIKPNLLLIQYNGEFIVNNNAYNSNNVINQDIYINMTNNSNIINYTVDNFNNTSCAICLDDQKINENWSILNCAHEFHNKCISDWLQRDNTCPTCRHLVY